MIHLLPIVHDTPEWEMARRSSIGSSDGVVIAALNPSYAGKARKTVSEIIAEKLTGIKAPVSEPMARSAYWGHLHEPAIAEVHFSRHMEMEGVEITALGKPRYLFYNTDFEGASCSPDYLWRDKFGLWHILEIKTTAESQNTTLKQGCPEHWKFQLFHQMAVCGIPRGSIMALCGGNKPYHWDFTLKELDTDAWKRVMNIQYAPIYNHLLENLPPEVLTVSKDTFDAHLYPMQLDRFYYEYGKNASQEHQVYGEAMESYVLMGG